MWGVDLLLCNVSVGLASKIPEFAPFLDVLLRFFKKVELRYYMMQRGLWIKISYLSRRLRDLSLFFLSFDFVVRFGTSQSSFNCETWPFW